MAVRLQRRAAAGEEAGGTQSDAPNCANDRRASCLAARRTARRRSSCSFGREPEPLRLVLAKGRALAGESSRRDVWADRAFPIGLMRVPLPTQDAGAGGKRLSPSRRGPPAQRLPPWWALEGSDIVLKKNCCATLGCGLRPTPTRPAHVQYITTYGVSGSHAKYPARQRGQTRGGQFPRSSGPLFLVVVVRQEPLSNPLDRAPVHRDAT